MQDGNHDEYFSAYYSNIADEDLEYLSEDLKSLHLSFCTYISDLSRLPEICPNLEKIVIDCCPSVDDFSFLFRMPTYKK